ncbi:MAG: M1 family metallopeptidase, partial [Bacteroidetes bacterium]|nr:M1 family metallopeptidase [Bacteroidota bacterium]
MSRRILLPVLPLILLASCGLFKKKEQDYVFPEFNEEFSEEPSGEVNIYIPAATRLWNLVHTRLELDFDIPAERVNGLAKLRLCAFAKNRDSLVLDAKKMVIEGVYLKGKTIQPLMYRQNADTTTCTVFFQQSIPAGDTAELELRYHTLPKKVVKQIGEAITADQGIYFIDPRNVDPDVPTQVWTQGETESNSHWFPTLDAPNQKTTQWFSLRFPDTLVSLSNGTLLYSTKNGDGTRTDVWQQEKPHAPYLAMVAIGNWTITADKRSEDVPVHYYTEPEYARYANMVFGNTPEMIDFFGKITGVEYPWDKFDQVVVRDFVSGAMENTTAVVHNSNLQHDERHHLDDTEEDYISHELFHHWFGDLVTCESWANLVLNEGFATYGEYLWREHKYGKDKADELLDRWRWAISRSGAPMGPVVNHCHGHPDEMFNSLSYQKGGLLLHHLRGYLGDKLFFAGMRSYLKQHAYGTAELADLRMAYEAVSGEDLNWFFTQWYQNETSPELTAAGIYHPEANTLELKVEADWGEHRPEQVRLPFTVLVSAGNKRSTYPVMLDRSVEITENSYRFNIPVSGTPDWWLLDGSGTFPLRVQQTGNPGTDEPDTLSPDGLKTLQVRLNQAPEAWMREAAIIDALYEGYEPQEVPLLPGFFLGALKDRSPWVRETALMANMYMMDAREESIRLLRPTVKELVFNDPSRSVRLAALRWLSSTAEDQPDPALNAMFIALTQDSGIAISEAAIYAIKDSVLAVQYAKAGVMNPDPRLAKIWAKHLFELLPEGSE